MELGTSELVCGWLGLPPGAWPPDHYTLLGLPRGAGDFADVEARVLDRMERLRPYQLVHPDATTEGMNRLAQALVCLTDPVARAAYDRALGIAPPPFEVVEDEPLLAEVVDRSPGYEVVDGPAYEVVEAPARPQYEVVFDLGTAEAPAFEVVPDTPAEPAFLPDAPALPPPALKPRTLYRRLAALRRALRAWDGLRPVMANPAEQLATPVAVLLFLRAVADARQALPPVAFALGAVGTPGGLVAALVRAPTVLHTVRVLLPSQRAHVARDWRRGSDALRAERAKLRALARARLGRRVRPGVRIGRALRRTPELLLVALALVVVLVALVRRNS